MFRVLLTGVMMCCSVFVAADQLLAVAPNVERNPQEALEVKYRAFHDVIMGASGLDTRLDFMPIAEVRALIARREAQLQLGAMCGVKRHTPVVYSFPYSLIERHIVTLERSSPLTHLNELNGLKLGLVKGYFYHLPNDSTLSDLNIKLQYSKDVKTSVQMLLTHRVDAVVVNAAVAEHVVSQLQPEVSLSYRLEQPFSVSQFCYVLPDTTSSRALVGKINQGIVKLFKSGHLQRYIQPPYLPPTAELLQ